MHGCRRAAKNFGRRLFCSVLMLGTTLEGRSAWAGGFEIPDNGTQAIGRGAAFVAKADDGTAISYNPAGLGRQRGTKLLLDGNLFIHSFEFQRMGQFPGDPKDPATPWAKAPYPLVKNVAGPFFSPFLAVTSDFGYFDRLTFGAGLYSPPTIGNRTFPLGVENKPAASRYDFVQSRSTTLLPTASAGFRVTPWLDVGLSTHLVLANFDETTVSYADIGSDACKSPEYFRCDWRSTLKASATSVGATIGALVRPSRSVAFGASFRTPINITAKGTVSPEPPKALQGRELVPSDAQLALQLPWMLRAGGRYIAMDADFELYDLELDVTYEAWGAAQKTGPIVDMPDLGAFKDIQTVVLHGYKSTIGVRGGGAYNIDTGAGILSVRAGAYFDSSATDSPYTRLDYDTLAKVAGTFGVGFKRGSFGVDLGYAAVASIPRVVGADEGEIRPINGLKQGQTIGSNNRALPAVNEGAYRGFTHILSLGVTVSIDGFFGPPRPIHYGNSYEPNYVGDEKRASEPGAIGTEEKKPDETKNDKAEQRKKPDEADERPGEAKPEKLPEEPAPDPVKAADGKKPPTPAPKEEQPERKWWDETE